MKILLINQFTELKNQYGLDRYLHLLNFLNLHGAEAKLVRSSRFPENENDVNTIILKSIFKNHGIMQRFFCYIEFGLRLLFIKFKEDVIYCSTPNIFACFVALIKAKIMKKKFVFEVRDIWKISVQDLTNISSHNPFFIVSLWMEKLLLQKSDLIVHTMHDFQLYLKERGLNQKKLLFYLPQIIDTNNLNKITNFKEKKYNFIYSGSLKKKNNPIEFIKGFKLFRDQMPHLNAKLTVIGFPESKGLENYSKQHDLKVKFIKKYYKKNELLNMIADYDAGLLSYHNKSVYKYGKSFNKELDYKAAGLAIIDCKGNHSNIGDNTLKSLIKYSNYTSEELENIRKLNLKEVFAKHDANKNIKSLLFVIRSI